MAGAEIHTRVRHGGELSNNKGINRQGGGLSAPALTTKDMDDIKTAAQMGADFLAVSFPKSASDMYMARQLMRAAGGGALTIAKIERVEAVDALAEILDASDGLMVARGDLAVEVGDAAVPALQKRMIRMARERNKLAITATQMMESMISNPMPTRAEVMDVANAVLDGTDAVMLSAETAAGQYPAETVASMAKVCLGAEKMPGASVSHHRINIEFDDIEETIAMSAMFAANHMKGVSAIIAMSSSGRTPLLMSRISSGLPIFALSRHQETLNLCALYRGVTPVLYDDVSRTMEGAQKAISLLKDKGFLMAGDVVLLTQGAEFADSGSNTCRILTVE